LAVTSGLAALAYGGARRPAMGQESTPDASGEWTYIDDAGVTITRPGRPERVVAYLPLAAAFWDYGLRPTGYYGTALRPDGAHEVFVGNIDLDAVESIGETYGEMDLEKLVALKPDLIVNDMWTDTIDVWGLEPDAVAQVEQIAPIASVKFVDHPITGTLESVEKLAVALGADPEAPELLEAKAAFEKASADLKAAIAAKPGLKVLVMSGTPGESLYIANPQKSADLTYYQQLGLDVVVPDAKTMDGYWEELSWEQAGKYPADLFLIDSRQWSSTGEQLMQIPTFAALPAAKAGQFGAWDIEYVPSYQGFTPVIERLTEVIGAADPNVV
jgi:iron complex transport system substrate-binding protein